jgi:hypothetical protein
MFIFSKQTSRILACLTLLFCYRSAMLAEDYGAAKTLASGSPVRATHILGFPGVSKNASGDLSIQDHALRFQKPHGSPAQISVGSIQSLTLGEEDRQVGGVPMTVAKVAAPYGGGRVVSLFAHKKYDTVTLEYLDFNGAFHGAIFQLTKGQGQVLKSQLEAEGVHAPQAGDETTVRSTRETKNEVK